MWLFHIFCSDAVRLLKLSMECPSLIVVVYDISNSGKGVVYMLYEMVLCNYSLFLMYADDILLLAPFMSSLKNLIGICENELLYLDLCLNVGKSLCIRISPRYNLKCSNLITNDSQEILWVSTVRYLGVLVTCRPPPPTQRNRFTELLTLCLAK